MLLRYIDRYLVGFGKRLQHGVCERRGMRLAEPDTFDPIPEPRRQ